MHKISLFFSFKLRASFHSILLSLSYLLCKVDVYEIKVIQCSTAYTLLIRSYITISNFRSLQRIHRNHKFILLYPGQNQNTTLNCNKWRNYESLKVDWGGRMKIGSAKFLQIILVSLTRKCFFFLESGFDAIQ